MYEKFKNLKVKNKIQVGNFVSIFLLILFASTVFQATKSLMNTLKWTIHTEKIISSGHKLTKEILNMETGERGFLITGKQEFLEPYKKGLKEFFSTMEDTKRLIKDDPIQTNRLEHIEKFIRKWLENAGEKSIKMREAIKEDGLDMEKLEKIVSKSESKIIDNNIQKIVDQLYYAFTFFNNNSQNSAAGLINDILSKKAGYYGFLITGDEKFLTQYNFSKKSFETHLKELYLIIDNQFNIDELKADSNKLQILISRWNSKIVKLGVDIRDQLSSGKKEFKNIGNFIYEKSVQLTLSS